MQNNSKLNTILLVAVLVLLAGLVLFTFSNRKAKTISDQKLDVVKSESIKQPLAVYENKELHFSFSYPAELGSPKVSFDEHSGTKGSTIEGVFPLNDLDYSLHFGASSPDYIPDPSWGRGFGLVDVTRSFPVSSDVDITVSTIQGDGISGQLLVGTDKCIDMCFYADGNYVAIFPIPANDKGIKVMGLFGWKMSKDDFLKLASTFKILK